MGLALLSAFGGFWMQVCLCSDHGADSEDHGHATAVSRRGHHEPSAPRFDHHGGAGHESGSPDGGRGPALAADDHPCHCVGASFAYLPEEARKNTRSTTDRDFEVSAVAGGPLFAGTFQGRRRSAHSRGPPAPPQARQLFLRNCAFLI